MKALICFSVLACSLMSAVAQAAEPNVSCQLMYSRVDANEIAEEFKVAPTIIVNTKGVVQNFKGFTLEAKLTQQCAEDSNECHDAYQMKVFIKRDQARSQMHVQLDPGPYGWQRYSTALDIGRESAFLNCDYDTRAK